MSGKIIFIVAIVLVLVVAYVCVRLLQRRQERQWLLTANNLVRPILRELHLQPVAGQPVDRVWGRSLALVSYKTPANTATSVGTIRAAFASQGDKLLQLTDVWIRDGYVHLDVALMLNMATKGYVRDLHRLS